jgi:hypothetical protein
MAYILRARDRDGNIIDIPALRGEKGETGGTYTKAEMLDFFYPVGSVYMTADADFQPSEAFGGAWEEITGTADAIRIWKRTK